MNINIVSAECAHDMCSTCAFEDCACECHLIDRINDEIEVTADHTTKACLEARIEKLEAQRRVGRWVIP